MWLTPKPTEILCKTSRSKVEVVKSLEEIASFSGDRFKFPVRIFGNKLFVQRKYIVGDGMVIEEDNYTLAKITLKPSGQTKFVFVLTSLLCIVSLLTALIFLISGDLNFLSFIGLIAMSLFWLVPPRIVYSVALELRKGSIESLVLSGN